MNIKKAFNILLEQLRTDKTHTLHSKYKAATIRSWQSRNKHGKSLEAKSMGIILKKAGWIRKPESWQEPPV